MSTAINEPQTAILAFGDFCVNANKRLLLTGNGDSVPLMPKAFDTLLYLVARSGKIVSKDELMSAIWADRIVEENNLTQNISILRRVLGEKHGENRFIATVPGQGYKFVAEVRVQDCAARSVESAAGASSPLELVVQPSLQPLPQSSPQSFPQTSPQFSADSDRRHKAANAKNPTRPWLVALALIGIVGFSAAGFYFWRGNTTPAIAATVKTVAVLPFKPLVGEARNEALEMGITDTLINKISSSDEIIVRPFSSVRRYRSLEQDSMQAGQELGVDSVLEGSIQTVGEQIRISARLIRARDGKQLWSGKFDEKFTDIFSVQDSISERVLAALDLKLNSTLRKRVTKRYTDNAEAYQLYMKGNFHASKIILPEAKKGVAYYQQAIALDPNYVLPYVGLARAYTTFSLSGEVPASEAMPLGKAAAIRALELDDTLAESHIAVGLIAFWYDWNWREAEKRYQRAMAIDPNNPLSYFYYAHLNSNSGRHEDAIAMGKRARELDPLSLITNSLEGQFNFYGGRYDEAISRLRKTLELEPTFWHPHLILSMVYTEKGMFAEAVAEADQAAKLAGGNVQAMSMKGHALAKAGKLVEARAVLAELQQAALTRYVAPYNFAIIHNALGETDAAFDYLEKAFAGRSVLMVFLRVDPKWSNLKNDKRYQDLLLRTGL